MKQAVKRNYVILIFIALLASLTAVQPGNSTASIVDEIKSGFIDKVLPLDLSQYNVTDSSYDPSKFWGAADFIHYKLESSSSKIEISCYIHNNILGGCRVDSLGKELAISDRKYPTLNHAAIGFLERYGNYTKRDLSKMINMVVGADTTKDSMVMVDNLKFNVTFDETLERATFRFSDIFNGADYTFLMLGFTKGVFTSFSDSSARFTVGDTSVNISKVQAVDIALKAIESFSYDMPGGGEVSDFNVTDNYAYLRSDTQPYSTVLQASWVVDLYLNQTYPGSVHGLTVHIWANTGEVERVNVISYLTPTDYLDETSMPSPNSTSTTIPTTDSTIGEPFPTTTVVTIALTIAVICAVAGILVQRRKHKNLSKKNSNK
jgi:hypothetical protein